MPKFPQECIQRLLEAGFKVQHSYDELEDSQVNNYQGRLNVTHGNHRVWMFSHDNTWVIEYVAPSPANFVEVFDSPHKAIDDAINFFAGDERWQTAEKLFQYAEDTLPSRLLDRVSAKGFRWERLDGGQGYDFFKGTSTVSCRMRRGRTDEIWTTFYYGELTRTESKQWPSAEEAVAEVIRFMSTL